MICLISGRADTNFLISVKFTVYVKKGQYITEERTEVHKIRKYSTDIINVTILKPYEITDTKL